MATDILLTPQEAAQVLRVPIGTLRHLIRTGSLSAIVLPGRQVRIERSALERFLEEHRQ